MLIWSISQVSLRYIAGSQPDVPVFARPEMFSPEDARVWLNGFSRGSDPDRVPSALCAEAGVAMACSHPDAIALLVNRGVLVFRAVPYGLPVLFDREVPRDNAALAIRVPRADRLQAFFAPEATRQSLPAAVQAAMAHEAAQAWIDLSERKPAAGEAIFAQAAGMLNRARLLLMAEDVRATRLRLAWAIPSSALKGPSVVAAIAGAAAAAPRPSRGGAGSSSASTASDDPGLPPPAPATSPQAQAMIQAASNGTPFIQVCDPVLAKAA